VNKKTNIMESLNMLLQVGLGITSLVCLVMVIIEMFAQGGTGLGIATIVLTFLCGIGALIAFIWGWVAAGRPKLMMTWTVVWVLSFILQVTLGNPF
jgi:heme A synthase